MAQKEQRDHGGGIDAAVAQFGGTRAAWLDLSTGINPVPYPLPSLPADAWTALPDAADTDALLTAARGFWNVPQGAGILAAPGASALIARLPWLAPPGTVDIPGPTYNEHAAAFHAAGWRAGPGGALVAVHPNNPDGRLWSAAEVTTARPLTVIDESFCDVSPEASLVHLATRPGTVILKSFGKFWGLAGLRLGFAIAHPDTIARLSDMLGPWPVSGPALTIGRNALQDTDWAEKTRLRLSHDAARLDDLTSGAGANSVGGTILFRLMDTENAIGWQTRLARHHVWSRVFPYSSRWLRLGLPASESDWNRLEQALFS